VANIRTVLNLSPEAVEAIEAHAPSPNKKGEWASQAILEYARLMAGEGAEDSEDLGILERIDSRLLRLEKQMMILMHKPGR
jgi:hypothetical protein